jgi:hypothetical protein
MSDTECRCIENECPQCHKVTAAYMPGPYYEQEITRRLCVECRNKNCWTDYWEDTWGRSQMSAKEAMDTYDENIARAKWRDNQREGRD